jgi:TonB family protein
MRPRTIFAVFLAGFFGVGLTPAEAAPAGELHTFYGQVKAVDFSRKTITLKSEGKSYVFHVTNETKIRGPRGSASLGAIQVWHGAAVVMRVGEGGRGVAVIIRFDPMAGSLKYLALYSLTTMQGKTVSGMAFNNYVVYEPPADGWSTTLTYEQFRPSMFVLSVNPDGTVADVKPIQGLGYADLNARAVKWLKKWRFRPHSVTEVRMPFAYGYTWR